MNTLIKKYKKIKKFFKVRTIKQILLHIIHSNTTPHQIAFGIALGAFFSIIPTFSLGMFLSLFIAWKKKYNLLSTYLGTLIVNPINASFIYLLNYKVGSFILGNDFLVEFPVTFAGIRLIAKQLYLGGLILAIILSTVIYIVSYVLIAYLHTHKERKKEQIH